MVAKTQSCSLMGIQGNIIQVEVDVVKGLPSYETVGLADKAVVESRERVRSALRNSSLLVPPARTTVNLAPADLKKVGTVFDLPIAVGILIANEFIEQSAVEETMFIGELALEGTIRPVNGTICMAITAKENGIRKIFCPLENAVEAANASEIEVFGVSTLEEVFKILTGEKIIEPTRPQIWGAQPTEDGADFNLIRGQYIAKRAAEIAAAGGHNILLMGPPGGGKTMVARAMPTILPDLTFEEAIEITKIHSAAGRLDFQGVVRNRPFVAPHHSASSPSLVGGGTNAKPGEISIAHLGVLFLDEIAEFERNVLESLRQPLEDGIIRVSRINLTAVYPAKFMLVGAMNPCPCGALGSKTKRCVCSAHKVASYRQKLSGPLIDRIDIFVAMQEITYDDLHKKTLVKPESSKEIKKRVDACRKVQQKRFLGTKIYCNAHMTQKEIEQHCNLDESAQRLFKFEFSARGFSGRSNARTLRLARTIADMEESEMILEHHIAEALQYKSIETYWA